MMNRQTRETRYYFCTPSFLNQLKEQEKIEATPYTLNEEDHHVYAYDYLFHHKQINKGNGMFFLWQDPTKKGYSIEVTDESNALFVLLELEIPKEIIVETDYDNWCSFIMDLHEADGDLTLADEICRDEFGIEDGLEGSYRAIFDINENSNIQTLIPYLKWEWVRNIQFTQNKII